MNPQNALAFAKLIGMVKNIKRAGWLRYLKPDQVESVADHSFRIAAMTLALRQSASFDQRRCLEMALIHDVAQGIVGDYTPHCKITVEEKHAKEYGAINQILDPLGEESKKYYLGLWQEYEDAKTYESWIVKDLDKFQMIQQAFEYESKHGVDLTEFYACVSKMKTQEIKGWAQQLIKQRENAICEKKKSINNKSD